ncbi:hypothetical protein LWC34_08710 [Kibdelosporangium philippinense]|uniref:Uncharacterized protein n=1 Tax=Kibdelosporangium philippinense TaxID=211113 RepID=A0ABS8Z5Z1_9PSEU|nr:hypothetical protein [Kibdelosporangium philippinense]MCE7002912.1 hypothetical protein [Kibdelosporangium philippinense]
MTITHRGNLPAVALTPGLRLRTEIGVALHDLEQEADVRTVLDNLRGALAYTAAIGETAMIARAAENVRQAIARLDAGLVTSASSSLTEALSTLSPKAMAPVH